MAAHFKLPLDLPHAGTCALRIGHQLTRPRPDGGAPSPELLERVEALIETLAPHRARGENPHREEAELVAEVAAALARVVVDGIARAGLGHDRLGQAVRNVFECLERGEEGARLSLLAGEEPRSAMRPR